MQKKLKIILTGSLGHVSKPLATALVQKGHHVTVISSNPEKRNDIEALGAIAAIGYLEDPDFLTTTFKGSDAVYTMIPPGNFFDHGLDIMTHYTGIANSYAKAIEQSGIKRVVHLSSNGAHLGNNSGLVLAHHKAESVLNKLANVQLTFVRPAAFYYNLNFFINVIRNTGNIMSNYGAEDLIAWSSPQDVALVVSEEIEHSLTGTNIRYVASDVLTCNEAAAILGAAIGKPALKWLVIPGEQMQHIFEKVGMNPNIARCLIEMNECMHSGRLFEDYYTHQPALCQVKLTAFANEFARAFTA